jgi:phospholipid-binding lipoprotein MlaA
MEAPRRRVRVLAPVLASFLMGACATGEVAENGGVYDPFEPVNRVVLDANLVVDDYVAKPAAEAYSYVPAPIRDRIRNVLRNMEQPIIFANEMLQGDWEGAEVAVSRFFINSTIGLAGLHDVAAMDKRLAYREEDFGQTLAVWGVGEGPYLMLPLLGPSNARDLTGFVVDNVGDPIRWATGPTIGDVEAFSPARTGATFIDRRERALGRIEEIRESSIDFYATLRSLYQQRRESAIADGAREQQPDIDIPEYDFSEPDGGAGESSERPAPVESPGSSGDQLSEIPARPAVVPGPAETAPTATGTVVIERRSLFETLLPD